MANVQMPDGSVVAFPVNMSTDDINQAIATDPSFQSMVNPQPSTLQNIGNDWSNRANNITQAVQQNIMGQRTLPETGLDVASNAMGSAFDPVKETAKSVLGDTPQNTAAAIDSTTSGQKLGDLLMQGSHAVSDVVAKYPRVSEDVSQIASLLVPQSASKAAATALNPVNAVGDMLYDSGKASQDAAHEAYVQDLVLPKQTPTVKSDMALRTQQVGGTNVYQPTSQEQQIAQTVANIPGVSSSNSFQKNLNLIQDANTQEAQALKARLQQNDVPISDDTVINTLAGVRQNLAANPYISGADGARAADNVVNKALDIITSQPQTASSMLDARKQLDSFVASQKGDKTFNPALDSPISTAVQQVRQSMNNMVANAVPSADVLTSLQKQSNLYNAADNIAPKAAGEAPTRMGRIIQNYTPHNLKEAAGGAGVLGGAVAGIHYLPPSVLGAGLTGYAAYKGATAPTTRIMLGKALGGGQ